MRSAALWSRPWSMPAVTLLLFAAVVASRVPFASKMLYGWDSANFALALKSYNVVFHQPHPPGYPLYVGMARLMELWTHDANASYVAISVFSSAAAVALLFLLASQLYSPWVGLASALILGASVGFWGYGEVAYPYTSLAFFGTLVAWLCYLMWQGHRWPAVLSGLVLGIAGGVRPDLLLFLGPLWLVSVWRVAPGRLLLSGAVMALVVASWLYSAAQLSGGWAAYQQANAAQTGYIASTYSVFAQGPGTLRHNAATLLLYLQQMFGVALVVVVYFAGKFLTFKGLVSDHRLVFLLLWFLPPAAVYLFLHIGEPGYVLSLLPPLSIVAGAGIRDIAADARSAAQILSAKHARLAPLGSAAFSAAAVLGVLAVAVLVAWNTNSFLRSPGPGRLTELRAIDTILTTQLEYTRRLQPDSVVVLAKQDFRQMQYYLPGYRVRLLFDEYGPGYREARYDYTIPDRVTKVLVMDFDEVFTGFPASAGRSVQLSDQPRSSLWEFDVNPGDTIEYGYSYFAIKGRR